MDDLGRATSGCRRSSCRVFVGLSNWCADAGEIVRLRASLLRLDALRAGGGFRKGRTKSSPHRVLPRAAPWEVGPRGLSTQGYGRGLLHCSTWISAGLIVTLRWSHALILARIVSWHWARFLVLTPLWTLDNFLLVHGFSSIDLLNTHGGWMKTAVQRFAWLECARKLLLLQLFLLPATRHFRLDRQ